MREVVLRWPSYRMLPYEQVLALAEVRALLVPTSIECRDGAVVVTTAAEPARFRRLTYFRSFEIASSSHLTLQHRLEQNGSQEATRRQSTRYSVHGLHEYKGKFNPQVARALLNSAQVAPRSSMVLDPFCGSGTTLVEAAHLGVSAIGLDINPLAVLIANAKVAALRADTDELLRYAKAATRARRRTRSKPADEARSSYLRAWFAPEQLIRIEELRRGIEDAPVAYREILLVVASNLLREFSLQEPADLRIRRRMSAVSDRDVRDVFVGDVERLAYRVAQAQDAHKNKFARRSKAVLTDSRRGLSVGKMLKPSSIDVAITSPPYAMALPYIDTQRLSLVWLGLTPPSDVLRLQASLVGSREFATTAKRDWSNRLIHNIDDLPANLWKLCTSLLLRVGPQDGFRRQAVPLLLYRYLVDMRETFRTVAALLKPSGRFFLIVGHNHTVLSGTRVDLDTPSLLTSLAGEAGLHPAGRQTLDTYQRFGLHQKNAIVNEELLLLERSAGPN